MLTALALLTPPDMVEQLGQSQAVGASGSSGAGLGCKWLLGFQQRVQEGPVPAAGVSAQHDRGTRGSKELSATT